MIHLRPHHLLCLLTYVGKGYSPTFVENYDRIVARLNDGEEIEITDGPDDICAPIACDMSEHCHGASVISRDALAARDVGRILAMEIAPGTRTQLSPEAITRLRAAFASNEIRDACTGCDWEALCTQIAAKGYVATRVFPSAG
jgi:Uncharacterized conserved protein